MEAMSTLPDFQVPKIAGEDAEENKGTFTIEPLDKGFGYTFGNSLRRVLLSSLGGAAIKSVRIEGVAHEFSTVPGVKEDVTDIVLNLKDIVVRMHTDADEVEAPLVASGVGQRTDFDKLALEIETDGSLEPAGALREAAEILIKSLAIFTDADRVEELTSRDGADAAEAAFAPLSAAEGDDRLIEELEIGVRAYNCLKRAGIQTVGDLVQRSESELNAIPNFGKRSTEEVKDALHALGLSLRDE